MAGFFETLFGGGAEKEAAAKNKALTAQYGTEAQNYLTTGYDTGVTNLNKAIGAYDPLSALATKYNAGGDLYLDALGINGPGGNARATAAFQNNPGYDMAINAGLDVINRRRGIGNMSQSGNADIDALQFGQNLQNQQYGSWLQNLQQTGNAGIGLTGTVAAGQAGGYGSLSGLAERLAGNQVGVSGNVLSGNVNANNLQAAGEAAGAKNLLGAGLSLASLAMGGVGGGGLGSVLGGLGGGGGGLGSALGSMGITYGKAGTPGSNLFGPVY